MTPFETWFKALSERAQDGITKECAWINKDDPNCCKYNLKSSDLFRLNDEDIQAAAKRLLVCTGYSAEANRNTFNVKIGSYLENFRRAEENHDDSKKYAWGILIGSALIEDHRTIGNHWFCEQLTYDEFCYIAANTYRFLKRHSRESCNDFEYLLLSRLDSTDSDAYSDLELPEEFPLYKIADFWFDIFTFESIRERYKNNASAFPVEDVLKFDEDKEYLFPNFIKIFDSLFFCENGWTDAQKKVIIQKFPATTNGLEVFLKTVVCVDKTYLPDVIDLFERNKSLANKAFYQEKPYDELILNKGDSKYRYPRELRSLFLIARCCIQHSLPKTVAQKIGKYASLVKMYSYNWLDLCYSLYPESQPVVEEE